MDWRDYVSSDPTVCHGRACIMSSCARLVDSLDRPTGHVPDIARRNVVLVSELA